MNIEEKHIQGITPRLIGWFMGTFISGTIIVAGFVIDARVRIERALVRVESRIERVEWIQSQCIKSAGSPIKSKQIPVNEKLAAILPTEDKKEK